MKVLAPRVDLSVDYDQNMKKFLAGRVDLVASIELSMIHRLKQHGLSYEDVNKTVLLSDKYSYYLALNKSVPDELVKRLQKALDKIKKDGRFDKLYQSYLKAK